MLYQTYEEAIDFVMQLYMINRETAIRLYWDEIEAYMRLVNLKNPTQ